MKRLNPFILIAALAPLTTVAHAEDTRQPASPFDAGISATHHATGRIVKVDGIAGMLTLAHGPVTTLNWPPMTMAFGVQNTRLLDTLSEGQTIDFEFAYDGSIYTIAEAQPH
ncbi:copper-binding protein [Alloalcanivorax xenomutans]|uniref:copper-binding protein n=1 Tax=Alloalcanivorax xenomutans TaxID=1094342 RepID=UPI003BA9131D